MKKRYHIRENARFQQIRHKGRSHSDKMLVLCVMENNQEHSRFGFSISKRIGNAVVRNRIKRRLREIMRARLGQLKPGWDLVFIARHAIRSANYYEMDVVCARLVRRANLLVEDVNNSADNGLNNS